MQGQLEFSFSDLKCKLVINVTDGKILGNIIDVVFFPQTGKILGFVVPGAKKSFFKPCENLFIPYNCVCKVGCDVILVELFVDNSSCNNNKLNNMINILDQNKQQKNTENNVYTNTNSNIQTTLNDEDDYKKLEVIDPNLYPK